MYYMTFGGGADVSKLLYIPVSLLDVASPIYLFLFLVRVPFDLSSRHSDVL